MEKVKKYTKEKFIERIANRKYTALYKDGIFVGGLTINNKNDINEINYNITCTSDCLYVTINHNHNIITIVFDSFNN